MFMMEGVSRLNWLQLFLAVLENLTMAGTIYGWSAINRSMLKSDSKGNPGFGDDFLESSFVYAISVNNFAALPLGLLLDRY